VGVPVVKIGNVTGGGSVSYQDLDCVSEDIARSADNWKTRENDTLIAMTGANVGKVAKVGCNDPVALINQRVGRFVPHVDQGFSKEYIHCLVSSKQAYEFFRNAAYGSAQPNISARLIEMLPIPKYERDQANRLGAVFSALDDKIALNRRTNETLEGLARALFKDWFVDFGPTRAKASGAKPTLAPEIWSLFPDRLDDNGLPEGWEEFTLENIAEHHKKTINPAKTPNVIFEHFSLPSYDKGQNPVLDEGGSIKSNKTLMPVNAVLLSKLNPEIARVWMPETSGVYEQICSTEFLVFTAKEGFNRSLLYCLFSDGQFRDTLQSMVTGTSKSHQRISPPALAKMDVLVGKSDVFSAFDVAVSELHSRILANRAESRTLAQTRDLLLPKLMSGELRVREAEGIMEGVA